MERLRATAAAKMFELRDARAALSDEVPPAIERDRGRGFGEGDESRAERFPLPVAVGAIAGRALDQRQLPILRPSMVPSGGSRPAPYSSISCCSAR